MIEFSMNEGSDQGSLVLVDDVLVQHAQELRNAFIDAMQKTDHLVLDLGRVDRVDVAALQVLCAGHRAILSSGKRISLAGEPSRAFMEVVHLAGFQGCVESGDTTTIWQGLKAT
ncbi:MAG: STAS domain-containing protein [Magnetococcales bacterium]|nr:STAS domain-containing protein [Magnetococcales bacterium]